MRERLQGKGGFVGLAGDPFGIFFFTKLGLTGSYLFSISGTNIVDILSWTWR